MCGRRIYWRIQNQEKQNLDQQEKELRGGDEESVKMIELKKMEQGGKNMKEFI